MPDIDNPIDPALIELFKIEQEKRIEELAKVQPMPDDWMIKAFELAKMLENKKEEREAYLQKAFDVENDIVDYRTVLRKHVITKLEDRTYCKE